MALRLGCAAIKQWQLDVFECAGARQQVEALKYEAEISPPQQGALVAVQPFDIDAAEAERSEEHTSELQSLMRISYAVFCLKKKKKHKLTAKRHKEARTPNRTI